jgi:hypothetical protein
MPNPIGDVIRFRQITPPHDASAKHSRGSCLIVDRKVYVDVGEIVKLEDLAPNIRDAPRPRISIERDVGAASCYLNPLLNIVGVEEIPGYVNPKLAISGDGLDHIGNETWVRNDIMIPPILSVYCFVDTHKVCGITVSRTLRSLSRTRFDSGKIKREAFCFAIALRYVRKI